MAVRITHTNNSQGHDGTYVYRSTSPMDPANLPAPIADEPPVAQGATFEYIDNAELAGDQYYRTQDHEGGQSSVVSDEVLIELAKAQALTLAADDSVDWTLSEGGTRALLDAADTEWHHIAAANSDTSLTSGKYYFEIEVIASVTAIGIREGYATSGLAGAGGAFNGGDGGRAQYFSDGRKRRNGTYESYGASYGNGDIIGILFDAGTKELYAYINGVGQGLMYTLSDPTVLPAMVSIYGTSGNEFRLPSPLSHLPDGAAPWPEV